MQQYNNRSKVEGGLLQYYVLLFLCCKNNWACFNEVALPYHKPNIYLLKWYENPESAEMPYKPLIDPGHSMCWVLPFHQSRQMDTEVSIDRVSGCTSS